MKEPIEYFGGTPTAEEGYKVKSQSLVSSIWSGFVNGLGSAVGNATDKLFNTGIGTNAAGISAAETGLKLGLAGNENAAQFAEQKKQELLKQQTPAWAPGAGPLGLAAGAAEAGWSYGVARPASTATLLANPDSPLYKTGTVEQLGPSGETEIVPTEAGFQLSDIQQAFNRSEDVSFGMALAANPIAKSLPQAGIALTAAEALGGIDQYDPWSVQDMADAQDNPFYKYVTGSADIGLQVVVPPAVKIARLSAMSRLGLTTSLKSGEGLGLFRADWERYRTGDTANNPWGDYITDIAETTNPTLIRKSPIVANANGVDKGKLVNILQQTDDADTVNEIALALRGDTQALQNLFNAAPDRVWQLSDLNDTLRNDWMNGNRFRPAGDDLARVNQIFDSAVDRDAYFSDVRKFFMSDDGFARTVETWVPTRPNIKEGGPVWNPLVNWLSKKSTTTVEKIRDAKGKTSYAISESDYSNGPKWLSEVTDSKFGQPATVFLHWVGRKQPLGTVTRSGARPSDLWDELTANLDTVPLFRGNGILSVGRELDADGVVKDITMSVPQYRQVINQRVLDGLADGRLQAAWLEAEDDMVRVMARTTGIDETLAIRMVDGYRKAMLEDFGYLQNNSGYLWDETYQRIRLSPDSTAQMLDSFPTLPINEIYDAFRGEASGLFNVGKTGQDIGIQAFDFGSKFFRTNVLFRFGYIPKNSVLEPMVSSMLAHGTVLSSDGVAATLGNFGKNMANRSRRFVYSTNLDRYAKMWAGKDPGPSRREVAKEMTELVRQREQTVADIENLKALHHSIVNDKYGPTVKLEQQEVIKGQLFDAQILLNNIEDAMDNRLPQWRQVVEPANLTDLTVRLREYRAVMGQDDEYVDLLRSEVSDIERAAKERSRAASPRARAERELTTVQKQIDDADSELSRLSDELDTQSVATDGSPIVAGRTPAERLTLDFLHPKLKIQGDSKKVGPVSMEWVERFVPNLSMTDEQIKDAQELAKKYFKDQSMYEPVEIAWDPIENVAVLDTRLDVVPIMAAKAARLSSVPVRIVTRSKDTMSEADSMIVPLPEGKWLQTKRPEQKNPGTLHPDMVFPDQYGIIDAQLAREGAPGFPSYAIKAKFTTPNRSNADISDRVRNRDLQAISIQRQRTSLVEQRDALMEQLDGMPDDDVINYTPNESGRKSQIESLLSRIEARKNAGKADDADVAEKIESLQAMYDEVIDLYDTPAINYSGKIEELEDALLALDEKISAKQIQQGEGIAKLQSVKGIRAYHGAGNGTTTLWVGDQRLEIPSAFSDRAYDFGTGYRAEASAANTSRQTYDPSYFAAHNTGRWKLGGGPTRVSPLDDTYWDELSHVGNRIFRNDKLIQRILAAPDGSERQVTAQWLATPEGRQYQKAFDRDYLKVRETRAPARPLAKVDGAKSGPGVKTVVLDTNSDLDDMIRLVKQYFPDDQVRKTLAEGEMSSGDLQRAMGARDDLKDILGEELAYDPNRIQRMNAGLNKALDKIWQFMSANIEDRGSRWPFYDREWNNQMQQRIDILKSQGQTIDDKTANALRQSAHRATLVELEKTFYNIRRYSTPVYAARFLMGFPGAYFNSLYRYGRFAAKEPERVFFATQMYGNMLEHMGVDENGNPTGGDLSKAVFLVIPGTRSNATDAGIRIPVASFEGLAVGNPGLSWLGTMAVSVAVANNPTVEEIMKARLGPAMYETVFPYGIPKDPRSVLLGAYQKELLSWVGSFDTPLKAVTEAMGVSDEKFLTTSTQIYANSMAQWEKDGQRGEEPSFQGAMAEARAFILSTAGIKWANPGSTNRPVAGQLMRDEWYDIREAFGPERTDEARQYYIEKYGDWARWYTESGSSYQAYIPSSQDAYKRVYKDFPELASQLLSLDVDDPSMVALLTIGTSGDFSESVSNFLRSNPLPGDSEPVYQKLTPEQFANKVQVDDGWTWYINNNTKYKAERERLATLRDQANTAYEKQYYRQWIDKTDKAWRATVDEYKADNIPWAVAKTDPSGTKADKAALFLTKILTNKKFKDGPGKDQVWQTIDQFLTDRDAVKKQLAELSSTEEKQALKEQFFEYVQNDLIEEDPNFGGVFDRYFSSEWVDN